MTPEEVYQIWAPVDSIWSPWAIPVPFAQMVCMDSDAPMDRSDLGEIAGQWEASADLAVVVDLPGETSIKLGLALAQRGFRPVPVLDGSPGPGLSGWGGTSMDERSPSMGASGVAVDMRATLRWLCRGAALLRELPIASNASPAFLLDAYRMAPGQSITAKVFDNRWKTFPQDYPSARFFKERGICRVVLIQELCGQPQEDLSHVLLRWQQAGIRIEVFGTTLRAGPVQLNVNRPSYFRALWQRALAVLGLRRGSAGGFGDWPHSTGGG
jgi:hypothetical protein